MLPPATSHVRNIRHKRNARYAWVFFSSAAAIVPKLNVAQTSNNREGVMADRNEVVTRSLLSLDRPTLSIAALAATGAFGSFIVNLMNLGRNWHWW